MPTHILSNGGGGIVWFAPTHFSEQRCVVTSLSTSFLSRKTVSLFFSPRWQHIQHVRPQSCTVQEVPKGENGWHVWHSQSLHIHFRTGQSKWYYLIFIDNLSSGIT